MVSFPIGWGSVTYVLVSELVPTSVRSETVVICNSWEQLLMFVTLQLKVTQCIKIIYIMYKIINLIFGLIFKGSRWPWAIFTVSLLDFWWHSCCGSYFDQKISAWNIWKIIRKYWFGNSSFDSKKVKQLAKKLRLFLSFNIDHWKHRFIFVSNWF